MFVLQISVSTRSCFYSVADSMADSPAPALRQLNNDFLSCGICLERYTTPKVLPCLHTFCECCLQDYIPPHSISVTCPICRQQSILPEPGVCALQNNFFVIGLMDVVERPSVCTRCKDAHALSKCTDCDELLCAECVNVHATDDRHHIMSLSDLALSQSDDGDVMSKSTMLVCPKHDGQSLDFYCADCETVVCEDCTLCEHSTHRNLMLTEAIQEHRRTLQELLQQAQTQIPVIRDTVSFIRKVSASLAQNHRDAESRVADAFDSLGKLLLKRKDDVIGELENQFSAKQRTLDHQVESLEALLHSVDGCCECTQHTLTHGNETEVLLMRKEVTDKLSQLTCSEVQKHPDENAHIAFDDADLDRVKTFIGNFGAIDCNSAVAHETIAVGAGLKRCYANKPMTVTITTKDCNCEVTDIAGSALTAELLSEEGSMLSSPKLVDNKNGTHDLTYIVDEPAVYCLRVNIYGQPIKNSPFKIKAYNEIVGSSERSSSVSKIPKTAGVKQRGMKRPSSSRSHGSHRRSGLIEDDLIIRVGCKGRNRGEFTNPQGITCTGTKILVADSNNQCVQAFSNTGDFKQRFGACGRLAGQMQRPTGVTVTINGNYLVADYDNRWVSVFGPDGKYINKIGTGKLLGPKGVCINNDGHIIVVDNKASCVFVFQPNGKLLHKFGSRGNAQHQFAGPHFCAVNRDDDIIVSDFHNHCIKVFNAEGTFLFSFGSNGEGNGQFNAPTGVTVDKHGNILVADWGNSRIQVSDLYFFLIRLLPPGVAAPDFPSFHRRHPSPNIPIIFPPYMSKPGSLYCRYEILFYLQFPHYVHE